MYIGSLTIHLRIPQSRSLKDKRRIIKGIKERLRQKFNISIAEVGDNDLWQSALLGVAAVGNDRRFLESVLTQVDNYILSRPEVIVGETEWEWH
ncbi:MAG: DUF503 domain-containing protein [bacterium]